MAKKLSIGLAILVAALAVAVTTAGCGGDDGGGSGGGGSSSGKTPAATKAANKAITVPAGATVIDQVELLFKPDKVTVKVGETVYFKSSDDAIHSVNVQGKNLLGQGGMLRKGEVASWSATAAGNFTVTCDYHPAMKATITVQ